MLAPFQSKGDSYSRIFLVVQEPSYCPISATNTKPEDSNAHTTTTPLTCARYLVPYYKTLEQNIRLVGTNLLNKGVPRIGRGLKI
jgi:hypothetical protein